MADIWTKRELGGRQLVEIRRFMRVSGSPDLAPHVESIYVGCSCGEAHEQPRTAIMTAMTAMTID